MSLFIVVRLYSDRDICIFCLVNEKGRLAHGNPSTSGFTGCALLVDGSANISCVKQGILVY